MAFTLWAKTFLNVIPMSAPVPSSPLYHILFKYLNDFSVICAFITIGLLILEALLINSVLSENDLIPRNSYIAAFVFVIVSGFFKDIILFHPVLIANLFIIVAIMLFLRLYEEHDAYSMVFNIGTLISIASMFYYPSAIFILLIWIGFIIYRLFSWREWFISILGFGFPYIFLASYYFWSDCLPAKIHEYEHSLHFIRFNNFTPTVYAYIVLAVLGVMLILSVFKLLAIINEKGIKIRKFLSFMIWCMIISFISLNISAGYGVLGFVMMLAPASILFTLYLNHMKKPFWTEFMIMVLALLLISGRMGLWSFS